MRDPEQTKKKILTAACVLFNTKGYKATSISDITSLAGITKGAIYKHFKDKAELEKGCLTNMTGIVMSNLTKRIREAKDAPSKLDSILSYFEEYGETPPFEGGCPLMNAAIEVDDTDIVLKKVVSNIMLNIQTGIIGVITQGLERNQLKNISDPAMYATLIYSSIEGGLMMMKVTDNAKHLKSVIQYLKNDIKSKTV